MRVFNFMSTNIELPSNTDWVQLSRVDIHCIGTLYIPILIVIAQITGNKIKVGKLDDTFFLVKI